MYIITIFICLFDQIIKYLITETMFLGQSIPVISNFFHISYVQNSGAAFGIFSKSKNFLAVFSIITIFLLIFFKEHFIGFENKITCLKDKINYTAFACILGGAIGNLIDRLRFAYVIDFLDFRIWPVFNIADTFISIGVGLFLICTLLFSKKVS